MVELIYKRPVESTNEGNLIIKDFICKAKLIRTSEEGSELYLLLSDTETNEIKEESLIISGKVNNLDKLKEYLLNTHYFYELPK